MGRVSVRYHWILALQLAFILFCLPSSPQASADGGAPNLAYVAGTPSGVSVIDVGQAKVTKTIAVAGDPHMILLSPDGQFLYATQASLGRVAVIDAKTGQTVCAAHLPGHPTVLALSLDATVLYAAAEDGVNVSALDPATCRVQQTYQTGGPVNGLAVTALGGFGSSSLQLWVTEPTSLSVYDVRGPLLAHVPIGDGPQYLTIPNGLTAYVTTRRGTVLAVDLSTRRVSPALLSGGPFGPMDYDGLTGEVYVPDKKHNVLEVLTPIAPGMARLPKEPNRVIHTGVPPEAVAITSDGLLGFVALQGGKVAMYDLIGRHIVYTVAVGGAPHFIITGLYPPTIAPTSTKAPSPHRTTQSDALNIVFYVLVGVFFIALLLLSLLVLLFFFCRQQSRSRSLKGKGRSARHC
jgi:DNA-binding beta-propeller fold protein YncE